MDHHRTRVLGVSVAACSRVAEYMHALTRQPNDSNQEKSLVAILSLVKGSVYYDEAGNVILTKGERFVLGAIKRSLLTDEIVEKFDGIEIAFRIPDTQERFYGDYRFDFEGEEFTYEKS